MATANINVPMLEAGKKYRLLLSPSSNSTYSFNVPSIDFTVPPSVRLISSYTPKTAVDTTSTGISISTTSTSYTAHYGTISDWSRSAGYYTYYFKVGSIANSLSTSDHIKVKDISSGDHRYYDNLKYRVKARNVGPGNTPNSPGWIQCIASYDPNFAKFCHPSSTNSHPHNDYNYWNPLGSYWKYLDGRALSSGTNANSATFSWVTSTTVTGTPAYLTDVIFLPTDFSLSNLMQTTNIRDIIIYFYKKDNDYYYVNYNQVDKTGTTPVAYTPVLVDPGSPVSMEDTIGKDPGDPLPFSMYDYLINNRFISASNYNPDKYTSGAPPITYYFTVARYVKNDSGTWEGKWLQVDQSWYENPSMENIIFSQKAEVA